MADEQSGVFSVGQALAAGWTRRQIRYRLRTGDWYRVLGDGLSLTPSPYSEWARGWAGHLTVPGSVVARMTAARLRGWPVPPEDLVHVIAPRAPRPRAGLCVRVRRVMPEEVDFLESGLPVTASSRTAIDTLRLLEPENAERLWAWLSTRKVLTRSDLAHAVRRHHAEWGVGVLRHLLAVSATGAVNGGERRVHALLRRAGLTGWYANADVSLPDGGSAVVDVLFAKARLVLEFDGYEFHSDRAGFVRDRRRQNSLILAGYRVLRITWDDLSHRPEVIVAQIRALLAA